MHGNGCPNLEVVARQKLLEPRPPTRSLTHPCRRSTQGSVKMSRAGTRTGGTSSSRTAVLVRPRRVHRVAVAEHFLGSSSRLQQALYRRGHIRLLQKKKTRSVNGHLEVPAGGHEKSPPQGTSQ